MRDASSEATIPSPEINDFDEIELLSPLPIEKRNELALYPSVEEGGGRFIFSHPCLLVNRLIAPKA